MSQEDMKQNDRGGFPRMRPRDDGNNNPRKGPRFSIYWIWGAIAVVLIGFNLFGSFTPDPTKIKAYEFMYNMLANGDVDKIALIGGNKNVVRVYIKPDSLKKEYYQKKLEKS